MSARLIGVDTNIIVRLLARDDARQHDDVVVKLIKKSGTDSPLFVNPVVVVEAVWVLERVYKTGREEGRRLLAELLNSVEFVRPSSLQIEGWSEWFRSSHADFSGVLIGGINRDNGCSHTFTFDPKAASRIPGMELFA